MFKITITGIAGYLLPALEKAAKIENVDEYIRTFTASFDGWKIKIKSDRVIIKNRKTRFTLILANSEFEEITIK